MEEYESGDDSWTPAGARISYHQTEEADYQHHPEKDHTVGIATVYRMIMTLEEAGVIDRRNMYRIGSLKEGA